VLGGGGRPIRPPPVLPLDSLAALMAAVARGPGLTTPPRLPPSVMALQALSSSPGSAASETSGVRPGISAYVVCDGAALSIKRNRRPAGQRAAVLHRLDGAEGPRGLATVEVHRDAANSF
jgi:hypothetical protein